MRRPWLRVGLRVAVGAFLVAGLIFLGDLLLRQWDRLEAARRAVTGFDWRVSAGWLAGSLALAVANLLEMSSVWVRLFRASGGDVAYPRGWKIWSATNIGRYIPGKVWHVTGLAVYLRKEGESGAAGLVSSVAFQVLILVTGAAAAAWLVVGRPGWLPGGSLLQPAVAVGLLVAALHPAVLRKATGLASRLMKEEDVDIDRIAGRDLLFAAAALLLSWGIYGLSLWALMRGLVGTPPLGPLPLSAVFAASYVVGYLAFLTPGGLLVREGAMVGLLASAGGLSVAIATVIAVAYRICVTLSELLFLGLAFAWPGPGAGPAPGSIRPGTGEGRPRDV